MPSARDPESIYKAFGRRLRTLRERKEVSQLELATFSGLNRSSIANIESGRQRVLLHQVILFAEALKVESGDLLGGLAEGTVGTQSEIDYLHRISEIAGSAGEGRTNADESEDDA